MRCRAAIAAIVAGRLLWGAEFWEKKAFTEWSYKEVNRVLSASPWARTAHSVPDADRMVSVVPPNLRPNQVDPGIASPMGGLGVGGERMLPTMEVLVRWHSSLAVRQALARMQYGDRAAASEKVKEFLERPQRFYVITVSKIPARFFEDKQAPELRRALAETAFLRVRGLNEMKPADIRIEVDAPALTVFFAFPRLEAILPEHKEAEFEGHIGPLKVRAKFRLSEMIRGGKLDL